MRLTCLLLLTTTAHAQWTMQNSGTTAGLRGIHNVDDKIAWASGTNGTILRTTDGGATWTKCATPPDGEKLDFRGVVAGDESSAMVMPSGPADKWSLFRTEDGCKSWDKWGEFSGKNLFLDAMATGKSKAEDEPVPLLLVGDPISGKFASMDISGLHFAPGSKNSHWPCPAKPGEAAFAASNSAVFIFGFDKYILVTGGKGGPRAFSSPVFSEKEECPAVPLPLASGSDSAGAFSVYFRDRNHGVVVGGDYKKPNESADTAAFTSDGGKTWKASTKLPHGYRSAVQWLEGKTWIAVGTNGSDVSYDDGRTWQPFDSGDWNALSLPYVVGPNGRIAKLDSSSLRKKK